jgi:hypothetical protein
MITSPYLQPVHQGSRPTRVDNSVCSQQSSAPICTVQRIAAEFPLSCSTVQPPRIARPRIGPTLYCSRVDMRLLTAIPGMIASLLPDRYRQGRLGDTADPYAATLSGIAESMACGGLFILRFIGEFENSTAPVGIALIDHSAKDVNPLHLTLASGVLGLANFLLQPVNLLLMYFCVEGAVRAAAALITDDVRGTLPLAAVAWLHGIAESMHRRWQLGPPVMDRLQPGDGKTHDLCVVSCRPKEQWNSRITIRFRNEFYVLVGEEIGEKPRPYVYRLRKNPVGRLVVIIRDYKLEET